MKSIRLGLVAAAISSCSSVQAQDATAAAAIPVFSIKSGETINLGPFAWTTARCEQAMKKFLGLDKMDGPEGIELTFDAGQTQVTKPGCSKEVSGGHIMAVAKNVAGKADAILTYRVRFEQSATGLESQYTKQVRLLVYP